MTEAKIKVAISEARRFLDRADQAVGKKIDNAPWEYGKLSGSIRRASLDLTRALADMRKP